MTHTHDIIDSDKCFTIDPKTRGITFLGEGKLALIQGDHNSERVTFAMPRYVEGHDMLHCTKVEVHYNNISADKKNESRDTYKVKDVKVSPDSADVIIFSWLISGNATVYAGILSFAVSFKCLKGSKIDYAWHTDTYNDATIGEFSNNGEAVMREYSDVLEAWKQEVLDGIGGGDGSGITGMVPVSTLYTSMPDYVNVSTNSLFKIYFRNVLSRDDVILWVGYNSSLTTRYYDDCLTVSASVEGTFKLPWKVYDKGYNLLESGELSIVATAKNPSNTTKVIVIGDSTVAGGQMVNKAAELYSNKGATLKLLGTRGSGTHEGRAGWTAKQYCTESDENPFYRNGFDFSYYMQTQNYSGVRAVVLQLGVNDIFAFKDYDWALYDSTEALGYLNQMVTSILSYDSSIKVIINLPITPNSNGTSFTNAYGTTQIYWIYNRNIIRFAEEIQAYYADRARVVISASNCVLDTKTQIRDGVHPTDEGYTVLGQRLYEVLVSSVEGVDDGSGDGGDTGEDTGGDTGGNGGSAVALLDITQRTRVDYAGKASELAAGAHEFDTAKCYDSTFNGVRSDTISAQIVAYTPQSSDSFILELVSNAAGGGIEFPLALEQGKSYTFSYATDAAKLRTYLLTYTADTVYSSNKMLSVGAGSFTHTITPEDGFIYSIQFCAISPSELSTVSGISLIEN